MPTQDEQDRINWIKNLIQLMCCDGRIADREKQFLRRVAKQLQVRVPDWNLLLKSVLHDARVRYPVSDETTAIAVLKSLIVMANADGRIDENEKRYILNFAKVIGLSHRDVKAIMKDMGKAPDVKDKPAPETGVIPAEAPAAASSTGMSHITAASDDFDRVDDFVEVAREQGRDVHVVTLDDLLTGKRPAGSIVCFHAFGQPEDTVMRHNRLREALAPSVHLVAVLTRYQGHHVRYLLEVGIAKCIIEPVYARDIQQICAFQTS